MNSKLRKLISDVEDANFDKKMEELDAALMGNDIGNQVSAVEEIFNYLPNSPSIKRKKLIEIIITFLVGQSSTLLEMIFGKVRCSDEVFTSSVAHQVVDVMIQIMPTKTSRTNPLDIVSKFLTIINSIVKPNKLLECLYPLCTQKDPKYVPIITSLFSIIQGSLDITSPDIWQQTMAIIDKHIEIMRNVLKCWRTKNLRPNRDLATAFVSSSELVVYLLNYSDSCAKKFCTRAFNYLTDVLIVNCRVIEGMSCVAPRPYVTNLQPLVTAITILYEGDLLSPQQKLRLGQKLGVVDCANFILKNTVTADRSAVIQMFSTILVYWAIEKELIKNDTQEMENFKKYLIESLTDDLLEKPENQRSIASHLLYFYMNEHRSREVNCPSSTLKAIVDQILNSSTSTLSLVPQMKVLAILLRLHLKHSEMIKGELVPRTVEAVTKLFRAMKKNKIARYLVHGPEIVIFILLNADNDELKLEILRAWIKRETDVSLLILKRTSRILAPCLWALWMVDCHNERIGVAIERGQALNPVFSAIIGQFLSETFLLALKNFNAENEAAFLWLIEFWSHRFDRLYLPKEFAVNCSADVIKIITEHSDKPLVRRWMSRFLQDLLVHCAKSQDFTAAKIFIKNLNIFKILYLHLSADPSDVHVYTDLFGTVLAMQNRPASRTYLESDECIMVDWNSLKSVFLTGDHWDKMGAESLRFWTHLFANSIDKPIFKLSEDISEAEATPILLHIFDQVVSFEKKGKHGEQQQLFQCLLSFFAYVVRKQFWQSLSLFSHSVLTYHLVESVLNYHDRFPESWSFITCWVGIMLHTSTTICECSDDVIRSHKKEISPFGKVLIKLEQYIESPRFEEEHPSYEAIVRLKEILARAKQNFPTFDYESSKEQENSFVTSNISSFSLENFDNEYF